MARPLDSATSRDHTDAMRFGFEIFEAGSVLQIVERDVAPTMGARWMPHPTHVLPKFRGTNARETNPCKALVLKEQSPAKAQRFTAQTIHLVQMVDALDLKRLRIHNHDMPIE